jgi:uncharacterized protein YutE (UPF0331/DUF86 family)
MDIRTFIIELLKTLIWPSVVITCIFLLKKHIFALVPNLKELEYAGLHVKFGDGIVALRENKATLLAQTTNGNDKIINMIKEIQSKGSMSPIDTVLRSWLLVENAMKNILEKNGNRIEKNATPSNLIAIFKNTNKLNNMELEMLNKLRALRNVAVHSSSIAISENDANEYLDMAARLVAIINS